jgi:general secretion pathway protein H
MPTSITATCRNQRLRRGDTRKRARAFTLLEVLVVMTIVAILTGTVMLSFTGADAEQSLKGAAERLALRVELARQRALTRNREWGIYIEPDSYAFAEFDPEQGLWVQQEGRPFAQNDVPEAVELVLTLADFDGLPFPDGTDNEELPHILVFSSGEITPFTIHLEPGWDTLPWLVISDGLSRTEASREGES